LLILIGNNDIEESPNADLGPMRFNELKDSIL